MRIGVLGITNTIGHEVSTRLTFLGHDVVALGRTPGPNSNQFVRFDLSCPITQLDVDLDAVVMLSWIGSPRDASTMNLNVSGYRVIAAWLRTTGIHPVFVSSVTASSESRSLHSRAKAEVESLFDGWGSVVQLGQVVDKFGKVAGRSARVSSFLASCGSIFRTELAIPIVHLDHVVDEICSLAVHRNVVVNQMVDEVIRVSGPSKASLTVSSKFVETMIKSLLVFSPSRRLDALDRWYALVDSQQRY